MIRDIRRWDTNAVIWSGEAETVKDALHAALAAGASGYRAYLVGANLVGANLGDAKNMRLPTGETWDEYLSITVPALLTAGGKSLESFAEHWQCHTWDNCPMAHAFDVKSPGDVPLLFRPRAEQFIQFYDSGQILWPLPNQKPTAEASVA